jgi:hypothetical protein
LIYNLLGITTFVGMLFGVMYIAPTTIQDSLNLPIYTPRKPEIVKVEDTYVMNEMRLDSPETGIGGIEVNIEEIEWLITYYSGLYEVDTQLALDLAEFESAFDPFAESRKSSAKGIYQFLDGTFREFCDGNVFKPADNIECAMFILSTKDGIAHWLADPLTEKFLELKGYVE